MAAKKAGAKAPNGFKNKAVKAAFSKKPKAQVKSGKSKGGAKGKAAGGGGGGG